jgi:integrase
MPQIADVEEANTHAKPKKMEALDSAKLKAIKPPATGRADYPDGRTPGLCLRVSSNGSKVWTLRMRDGVGNLRRFALGSMTDAQGLAWARREAERLRQGVRHAGQDPQRERRERVDAARLTLKALVEGWRKLKLADRKPRYRAEAERALENAFKAGWEKAATTLSTADVRAYSDKMQKAGQTAMASAVVRYGRAAFNWAVKRGMVASNPFAGQDAPVAKARDRVLTDGELAEVLITAGGIHTVFGKIVHMLALTGQRRDEVTHMAWHEFSEDRLTWTIPADRAKNGLEHIVPLSEAARALLPAKRAKGYVFEGDKPGAPFSGFSKTKARLDQAIVTSREKAAAQTGTDADIMPRWVLHDLRRTFATGLQRLGVRLEVTEACLNHVSGSRSGIVGVYQRHTWAPEKRAAMDAWAVHVVKLIEGDS